MGEALAGLILDRVLVESICQHVLIVGLMPVLTNHLVLLLEIPVELVRDIPPVFRTLKEDIEDSGTDFLEQP